MHRTQQAHLCHHGRNRELLRGYLSFLSEERKNSSELRNLSSEVVLFLKKVHSWEGVTEMVLGLFLLFL